MVLEFKTWLGIKVRLIVDDCQVIVCAESTQVAWLVKRR